MIEDLVIPEGIEKISNYLFYNLDHIKSVTIPNSVTSIGSSAFSDCDGLTSVTIGDSVTSIGNSAFKGCDNIKKIESKANKAPTIENEDQFSENVYANADLFVPIGYEDNYKNAYYKGGYYNDYTYI